MLKDNSTMENKAANRYTGQVLMSELGNSDWHVGMLWINYNIYKYFKTIYILPIHVSLAQCPTCSKQLKTFCCINFSDAI